MIRRLQEKKRLQQSPVGDITQDLFSKELGSIAQDIFESSFVGKSVRKMTKSHFRQQQIKQKRTFEEIIEKEFIAWFENLKSFILTISTKSKTISRPNSERLINKLDRYLEYSRVRTKIEHTNSFIDQLLNKDLIYNQNIPKLPLKKKLEEPKEQMGYGLINNFERELRNYIVNSMNHYFGDDWWNRVSKDVNKRVIERRENTESPLIDYVDFSDYSKIIIKRDNWSEVFQEKFQNKDRIKVWLEEINQIRNKIMHSRKVSETEMETLKLNIKKIQELMKQL